MAKRSSSALPAGLRHRGLLDAEAALVVGLAMEFGSRYVQGSDLPHWGKVLFIMAMTVGLLGFLVLFAKGLVGKAFGKTFLIAPLPRVLMHIGLFTALFFLYALVFNLPVLR
jgi:hypothetical protein